MARLLVIDIETRPDPRLVEDEAFLDELRDEVPPNKAIKDPLKQQAWIDAKVEERVAKMALSPTTGCVAVIGFQIQGHDEPQAFCGGERSLLDGFAHHLKVVGPSRLGGHNLRKFDLPFLNLRFAVHGVAPPAWWPQPRDWRNVIDTCDVIGQHKLDQCLRAVGFARKTATGEESLRMPLDELVEYCKHDVQQTLALIQRLRPMIPELRRQPEEQGVPT